MLSTNAALLDGGAMLQRCIAGVGHLLSRPQLMRSLAQDPAFLYQVRRLSEPPVALFYAVPGQLLQVQLTGPAVFLPKAISCGAVPRRHTRWRAVCACAMSTRRQRSGSPSTCWRCSDIGCSTG